MREMLEALDALNAIHRRLLAAAAVSRLMALGEPDDAKLAATTLESDLQDLADEARQAADALERHRRRAGPISPKVSGEQGSQ